MAALTWKDRIKVASATTGTGTLTLGAAASGYRTFAAGDNGKLFPYVIEDGTAWETGYGTYTHSGTTFARTTRTDSSTGSAISCTGAEYLYVDLIADYACRLMTSDLEGLELAFNSTTVIRVNAGLAAVNGSTVNFAQTDYTSGSTMKDIANSTVTLAANKTYWVFLSSAGVIGIEINDGTGDGATPVKDSTLGYWKAASTGAAWRRIGKFWTNGSSQILKFYVASLGRLRRFVINDYPANLLVSGVNNASYTAVTNFNGYASGDDAETLFLVSVVTAVATTNDGIEISLDGGTNTIFPTMFNMEGTATTGGMQSYILQNWFPYTGTAHYRTLGGCAGYVGVNGYAQVV